MSKYQVGLYNYVEQYSLSHVHLMVEPCIILSYLTTFTIRRISSKPLVGQTLLGP